MSKYKLKENHYKIFYEEVNYWLRKLNLLNFEVFTQFGGLQNEFNLAECIFSVSEKSAMISLAKEWESINPTHKEICKAAYHETWEILLGQMTDDILDLNVDQNVITSRIHSVIRTLENTWFKESYAQRFEKKCCGKCKKKK